MVGCHPAAVDRGADRFLTIELLAEICSQTDRSFGTRDWRVRRRVQVRAERVDAANGCNLYCRKRRMIDWQIIEPNDRNASPREIGLNRAGVGP